MAEQLELFPVDDLAPNTDKVRDTLIERGTRYGSYKEVSMVSQNIKAAIRHSKNWNLLPADYKESLEMVANKLARVLCGDWKYTDSLLDISGYVQLLLDGLEGELDRGVREKVAE